MIDPVPHDPAPVFPRLLSGSPEQLRLSHASLAILMGYGIALQAAIHAILGSPTWDQWPLDAAIMSIAIALLTATVAARWLGEPSGMAAGLIQLTGLHTFGLPLGSRPFEPLVAGLATAAMTVFAMANVPGRLSTDSRLRATLLFYGCGAGPLLLFGWGEFAGVLLACLAYLLLNQDGRTFGFLVHPIGLGVLVIFSSCTIWLHGSAPSLVAEVLRDLGCEPPMYLATWHPLAVIAIGMLPWTPLGAVAVVAGCWRAHYATAFWQFVACWSLLPLVLASIGVVGGRSALAMTCPPLSIFAAAGFHDAVVWWRTKNRTVE